MPIASNPRYGKRKLRSVGMKAGQRRMRRTLTFGAKWVESYDRCGCRCLSIIIYLSIYFFHTVHCYIMLYMYIYIYTHVYLLEKWYDRWAWWFCHLICGIFNYGQIMRNHRWVKYSSFRQTQRIRWNLTFLSAKKKPPFLWRNRGWPIVHCVSPNQWALPPSCKNCRLLSSQNACAILWRTVKRFWDPIHKGPCRQFEGG